MSKITLNFSAKLSDEGKAAARKLIDGSEALTEAEWTLLYTEKFIFRKPSKQSSWRLKNKKPNGKQNS